MLEEHGKPSTIYFKVYFEHLMKEHLTLADRFTYCVHPVMADAFHMLPDDQYVVYPMPTDDPTLEKELGIV